MEEGLLECLSEIVGIQLVSGVGQHEDTPLDDFPQIDDLLRPKLKELYESGHIDQYLRQQADGIATAIIRTLNEQDFSPDGPISRALKTRSSGSAQVFRQLTKFRIPVLETYEAILPAYSASVVLKALEWFNLRIPHAEDPAITYHIVHRLFADLDKAPLVNEQVRILNALCLWIACHHTHFEDTIILHTLLNGAANIIRHIDLAPCAQSILHWGLTRLDHVPRDARLSEILLRAACAAHEYSTNTSSYIANTGTAMIQWAEEVIAMLLKSKHLRPVVKKALIAWPRDCPSALREVLGQFSLYDISSTLNDDRIFSNKFALVQHMKHLADTGLYDHESFSKRDFWKLKQCIPVVDHLLNDEVDSFISLLTHQGGRIDGLEIENLRSSTACARYLLLKPVGQYKEKEIGRPDQSFLARQAIVASLHALLDNSDASQVHLAFKTLRSLAAITTLGDGGSNGWPVEYYSELDFLRAYAHPLKASISCRQALIRTVLHLREWKPPGHKHPLDYDTWLDLDYILLSRNAVRCGAFTTALLFLELGAEYATENINALAKEQVLYQIYSHIDEPDGFYAISTQDVQGFLLKQLHHEDQWNKAFQFHGAALETRDTDPEGVNGVLHSLRAFGFDSLAMTTLQSIPGAQAVVESSMRYQLGWRAEVWDLPDVRKSSDTPASLYLALRAVHRERDVEIADRIIGEQLSEQMQRLRTLGRENLVEIREVSQVLMCLNEIRQWRQWESQGGLGSETRNDIGGRQLSVLDEAAE